MEQDHTNKSWVQMGEHVPRSAESPSLLPGWQVARVQEVDERGQMQVLVHGQTVQAWSSAWLGASVLPGQLVLLAMPQGHAALVVGVYPDQAEPGVQAAMRYDAGSDTLVLKASHVRVEGAQSLTLSSGASQLQMDAQGHLQATAQSILQSATGSYRLEGATVDIN